MEEATAMEVDETLSDKYSYSDNEDSDNDQELEDDDQSLQSEYSYYDSDEDNICCNSAPVKANAASAAVAPRPASAAKPKGNDPLAELDRILASLNQAFPEAVNTEDQAFLSLVTHKDGSTTTSGKQCAKSDVDADEQQQPDSKKSKTVASPKSAKAAAAAAAAAATTEATGAATGSTAAAKKIKTSTLKAGVGYETGNYTHAQDSSTLKNKMTEAVKKQQELDGKCIPLIESLLKFLKDYNGNEGVVLLTLKMSPGFNRLLFSLLKNDALLEWGRRRNVYDAALDLLATFSESKFYAGFPLHNLLEGDGSPDDGTSNCQTLLGILNVKSDIMHRSQKKVLAEAKGAADAGKPSPEAALASDTIEVCEKVIATNAKVNQAIEDGRECGTIVNPKLQLAGKCMVVDSDAEEDDNKPPPTEEEDIATYLKEMKKHRLEHVALDDAVNSGKTSHTYLTAANKKASGASSVKHRRMLRIASEIAGLSADLPIEWASGIFVRVDEDRPDIIKAIIMAPEGTPYENGCFEFDIFLPLTYPDNPPQVNLVTTDKKTVRFNPNLYNQGKVCLSLLGTWQGPGWIPETSTLLQVLVSIQSLILVPDPYFNEPGYNAALQQEQLKSKKYDRQVRAATLKVAILGQMKKPSPLFVDCINDHFRLKKRRILKQLDEWEELEKNAEADSAGTASAAATGTSSNSLVAGGGIKHSAKIVKDFCDDIRRHIEETWPDKKKKDDDE